MSLISLNCLGNQIELLDVSDTTKLETLECQSNIISSLIVTNTPKLNILDCGHNNSSKYTNINISRSINISRIYI